MALVDQGTKQMGERLMRAMCVDPPYPINDVWVAIIVAHPDDEVIGAGSRLPALRNFTTVHVTDGAPRNLDDAHAAGFSNREAYTQARRAERAAALALAGHDAGAIYDLDIADQEASLHLATLALRLTDLLTELRADVVLTHPYEGGHPDHDATAFAVHAAAQLLRARDLSPAIVEMASYHECDGVMTAGAFPSDGYGDGTTVSLGQAARVLKQRMYDCYTTQQHVLTGFPIGTERFRSAPEYDFTAPPRTGTVYYDRFDWGMRGSRWRTLARDAIAQLGLEPVVSTT